LAWRSSSRARFGRLGPGRLVFHRPTGRLSASWPCSGLLRAAAPKGLFAAAFAQRAAAAPPKLLLRRRSRLARHGNTSCDHLPIGRERLAFLSSPSRRSQAARAGAGRPWGVCGRGVVTVPPRATALLGFRVPVAAALRQRPPACCRPQLRSACGLGSVAGPFSRQPRGTPERIRALLVKAPRWRMVPRGFRAYRGAVPRPSPPSPANCPGFRAHTGAAPGAGLLSARGQAGGRKTAGAASHNGPDPGPLSALARPNCPPPLPPANPLLSPPQPRPAAPYLRAASRRSGQAKATHLAWPASAYASSLCLPAAAQGLARPTPAACGRSSPRPPGCSPSPATARSTAAQGPGRVACRGGA
jgi:hypothetical protein